MAIDALGSDGLAAALRSVQARGNATPIVPLRGNPYQPFAGTYEGGPRGMLPQHTPGVGQGGGGSGGGASGAGAGLEKLGAGVAQAMKGFAAKRAQQQQFNDMLGGLPGRSTFGGPAASSAPLGGGASASPISPLAAPYTPAPIGAASDLPIAAQTGAGAGEMGSSIGPGSSLPSFAAGMPGAPPPQTAGGGGSASFEPHHGSRNIVSAGDFYNALVQRGLSPVAAAAMTGNATFESGARPGQVILDPATDAGSKNWGTGSAAVGAMQWEGIRKPGVSPTLDSQADHIVSELRGGEGGSLTWDRLNSMTDPRAAASAVNNLFERPQYPGQSDAQRQHYAAQTYAQFGRGGGQLAGPSPSPNTAQSPPAASGAAAYAAKMPSAVEQPNPLAQLPSQISPGQTQTGPAYSDDTWNNRPQYDYGGQAPPSMPGKQSMNEVPSGDMGANQERGYFTNFQGMPPGDEMPKSLAPLPERQFPTGPGNLGVAENDQSYQNALAMALMQNNQPDFGNFFSGFGGNLFG